MQKELERTVAEYFAGIGLMRLGLDQAGWTTVFANDMKKLKVNVNYLRSVGLRSIINASN